MLKNVLGTFFFLLTSLYANSYVNPVPFSKSIKSGAPKPVSLNYHMPVITWADALLAVDNKHLFPKGIKLVDDPIEQINDVLDGKTPFIRQTVGSGVMIADALKQKGINMIVFHSVSDSLGGDVIVAKKAIKNFNQLEAMVKAGKKPVIAIQWGGPHMGWLVQLLNSIHLKLSDVNIKYTANLFGENSPESAIAEDSSVDIAFVISPSAATLTQGEYAIPGLHVLTSTKVMNDAIKDVIFVRADWAVQHATELQKIRNAYFNSLKHIMNDALIKETAELLFGSGKQGTEDLTGMRDETRFHNQSRSENFLYSPTNLINFNRKTAEIVAAYAKSNYISSSQLTIGTYDWKVKISKGAELKELDQQTQASVLGKVKTLDTKGQGQDIFKKTIYFKPNQSSFSETTYGTDFEEAIRLTATYGGAVIKIVGNVDPQLLRAWNKAVEFKKDGKVQNLVKVERYLKKVTGNNHNLQTMSIQLIQTELNNVRNAANQTSKERANAVKRAIVTYAKKHSYDLDASRMVVLGAGGDAPIYEVPKDEQQFLKNIRVEFVITNYNAEISEFSETQDF
ncbi:hypothetical protein KKA17_07715 [bacterium]|nr:hypothetical protein [bacterium]MBU1883277.1 hypothetical protein [bacterium]